MPYLRASPYRLNLDLQPAELVARLRTTHGLAWLDTATVPSHRGNDSKGAWSYVAVAPREILQGHIDHDWPLVETRIAEGSALQSSGKTPFAAGLIGWVGFDGEFRFAHYDNVLAYDHKERCWWGSMEPDLNDSPILPEAPALDFKPEVQREHFLHAVKKAQDYIAAGDVYQVNLAYAWQAPWPRDASAFGYYLRLRELSPAPYSAFLDGVGTSIISSSPECFLQLLGRSISTRPIKGTRPRFPADAVRDAQSMQELIHSAKEQAELLMITDLERNDLGQVCEYGSISVPELARVETFAQVFHLVSTVTGNLRDDVSHAAAFRACFPGGSISGAPKKRALEIIAELEKHPRGLYTGAIGYFGFNGESQFNIAIRTAMQYGPSIHFHVGAGIVADSVPELEYEETLHKATGLLNAAKGQGEAPASGIVD